MSPASLCCANCLYYSQRSTALVSLLPLPVETSEYLFKPTASQRKVGSRNTGLSASRETAALDFYNLQK